MKRVEYKSPKVISLELSIKSAVCFTASTIDIVEVEETYNDEDFDY